MRRVISVLFLSAAIFLLPAIASDELPLDGFSVANAPAERDRESKFRALPSAQNQREYIQHLSARPHHVGSAYDKENAQWILARFKEWGWDAHIEDFDVWFPTPKRRLGELVAPAHFLAKLH